MSSSPIRFHGSWKMQKRPSEPDRWLEEIGYYRKHIAKDSSCLFRAVSESVYKTQRYYQKVRKDCVNFMAANRHLFEGLEAEESVMMVDCRQAAGAPPQGSHEAQQMPSNGTAQPENQAPVCTLAVTSVEMNNITQSSGRNSTPAAVNAMAYGGPYGAPMGGGAYVYGGGMKQLVWCAPPHGPPPPGVNTHVYRSVLLNGSDLPMNDIATLRYYYNLGVECMWSTYGAPPPPPPPPPRFSQGDLVRDMQTLAIQAAPKMSHDKPPPAPKATQRPVMGPRFKRGSHQHDQKAYANKGPNNRRNSHVNNNQEGGAGVGGGEFVEPPMVSVPYMTYPPPVYPVQYYPIEDSFSGMMGGAGYVQYEEGVEYGGPVPQYFPPPHFMPHAPPPQVPHQQPPQVPHQQPPQGGEHK